MQRPQSRLKKTGFTLMEVVVVVTIIGLLAGLALPRISENWDRFAVRGAVNQFRSAHQKARTAAISSFKGDGNPSRWPQLPV